MKIENLGINHPLFKDLIKLELLLWPDNDYSELFKETQNSISEENVFFGAIKDHQLIGFIQISTRYDYVNGTSTSPVGFVEGIYVLEEYRYLGVAKSLMGQAIQYCKERNYKEIASDVLFDNIESQIFHEKIGFVETERVVYYLKKL
jgi:aminoglycoside 6'-N-acetyltransferase I